jgi:PST family polysaccharide transporter
MIKISPKIITPRERKVILKNFTSLSTLQGLNYILPVIILPYLIRVIGPEKFGLIAFAQAFVQYFMILTDYGFSLSATREISLCHENKKKVCRIFSSVMTVKIVLAIVSFVILLAIITFVPRFKNDWLVYILSFGTVIGNTLFPVWFFQGKEKMDFISTINIIGGILFTAYIFLFVKGPEDYLFVPLFTSLVSLATGFSGLFVAFKKFGLSFTYQTYGDIQKQLKSGWNIFVSVIAINAYTTTRVFAVGLLTNNTLTGYYSIAERIANFIQSFPLDSFSQAIFPRLNKIFRKDKARSIKLMNKLQRSTTLGFLISLPIVSLIAPSIVNIFCGVAYAEATAALRVLLIGVFFVGANAFRVQFLVVSGRADLYSKLHVAAALVGLPLIFLLINYFSYLGAAISTIIIEIAIIIATYLILNKLGYQLKTRR